MKIVCIGDSLTYGYGVEQLDSWVHLVRKRTGLDLMNKGINGDTTDGMLCRFEMDVLSLKPDWVFVMGGSNDLIMNVKPNIVESNIASMCREALKKSIEPIIGIPPNVDAANVREDWASYSNFSKVAEQLAKYRDRLLLYSRNSGIKKLDFYSEIEKRAISGIGELYFDGLHMNETGHKIMADIFCGFLMNNTTHCSKIK
ncbi:MAG: GDSL-type esterase/lipase family protein [Eubacteriales bacterium]|nr:GDSL-type esterase/lipase family protein [Eubacteriales bacterium]